MPHDRASFVFVIQGEEERAEDNYRQAAAEHCKESFHASPTEDRRKRFNDRGAVLVSSYGGQIRWLKL